MTYYPFGYYDISYLVYCLQIVSDDRDCVDWHYYILDTNRFPGLSDHFILAYH